MASLKPEDVIVVGTIGNPGQEESACIDVLRLNICEDVGKIIEEELAELNPVQKGYRDDAKKHQKQVKDYNDKSSK
jgi:hypothetical protein